MGYFDEKLPPQVLVVDDSEGIRDCLACFLRASGYRVVEADEGLAAQAILMKEQLALVITDLEMPVGNGWDLLTFCHATRPELPVLLMSGSTLGRRPEVERWAAGFLPKPFQFDKLRGEVRRHVARVPSQ